MLDFMLRILKQTAHIYQGLEGDFFNKIQGDFCRVSLTNAIQTSQASNGTGKVTNRKDVPHFIGITVWRPMR